MQGNLQQSPGGRNTRENCEFHHFNCMPGEVTSWRLAPAIGDTKLMPGDSPASGGSSSGPWPAFHGRLSTEAAAGFLVVFIKCDCQVSGSARQPAGFRIGTPAGDGHHSSDCGLELPQILSWPCQVCSNTLGDMGVVCPCGNRYHWLACRSGCLNCMQHYCDHCARQHEQCHRRHQEARSQQPVTVASAARSGPASGGEGGKHVVRRRSARFDTCAHAHAAPRETGASLLGGIDVYH